MCIPILETFDIMLSDTQVILSVELAIVWTWQLTLQHGVCDPYSLVAGKPDPVACSHSTFMLNSHT